jgi:hypothetical protein
MVAHRGPTVGITNVLAVQHDFVPATGHGGTMAPSRMVGYHSAVVRHSTAMRLVLQYRLVGCTVGFRWSDTW